MPAPTKTVSDFFVGFANTSSAEYDVHLVGRANGQILFSLTNEPSAGDSDRKYVLYNADASFALGTAPLQPSDDQHLSYAETSGGVGMRVWMSSADITAEKNIYAAIIPPSRTLPITLDSGFLINVGRETGIQDRPEVVALNDSNFLITWINRATGKIDAAVYDIKGAVVRAPFELSTSLAHQNNLSPTFRIDVTTLANGNAVVAYRTDSFDVKFQMVDSGGFLVGGEQDFDTGTESAASVTALTDGGFVMVTQDADAGALMSGRTFAADGTPISSVFNVFTVGADLPQIAALNDGRFIAVAAANDGTVLAQVMFADGAKDGAQFTVSAVNTGLGFGSRPQIATLADGRVAISWQTMESGTLDIKAAVYDPRESALVGSATTLSDEWIGTGFNDLVFMGAGSDSFVGAAGGDTIYGEAGADTLRGGDGSDVIYGGAAGDQLFGEENGDTLYGGAGADELAGGDGIDTAHYAGSSIRVVVNLDTGGTGGDARGDIYGSIENVVGSALGDVIVGNASANTLSGGDGNDSLSGGGGLDTLGGGEGDDILQGGAGADTLIGGGGLGDVASYAASSSGVSVNLFSGAAAGGDAAGDTFSGIEDLTGSNSADLLIGSALDNAIAARNGADTINGGAGFDILAGGGGGDTFIFNAPLTSFDRIVDFNTTNDMINLDDAVFTGLALGALAPGAFHIGPTATDGADRIIYNSSSGWLSFDADGTGATAQIHFATLVASLPLSAADFLIV